MTADGQWRQVGDRIQTLLDAVGSPGVSGPAARERAELLVREVVGLYGAALTRILELSDPDTVDRYADDELVASLLVVHGLHPHDVRRRVDDALQRVRPYLGSHGGDIELVTVTDDLVVQLRFGGSCTGCPSSAATLELAVEDAVRSAAPEISGIEVVGPDAATGNLFPAESLLRQVHSAAPTRWHPVPELEDLADGEVGGFGVDGVAVVACRVGGQLYAYLDHCPRCANGLAGAVLLRRDDRVLLRCPLCDAHFDVVRAGAQIEEIGMHLQPLPLVQRDGQLCVASAGQPSGVPA